MVIRRLCLVAAALLALGAVPALSAGAGAAAPRVPAAPHVAGRPDLGPNVYVFSPSMPQGEIQATVDAIANQQLTNQFGTQRYALLFEPGTYGSASNPLSFKVGYYTEVAGLGASPGDVVINGSIDVYNQCDNGSCTALNNFWRSLSNLTINVANASGGCTDTEFWAVSQAAPMRRVAINGGTTLMDYCSAPSYASGGFIADSTFSGGAVINGSQQQFFVRNSALNGNWTNGVWNQVFAGDTGAPAPCFPAQAACGGPYTTLATTPASREKPYLYIDGRGRWQVFVPRVATGSSGPTWTSGPTPGYSVPLSRFFVAGPGDSAKTMNHALSRGQNLLLTPGVYDLDAPLKVRRPDTIVLGLGMATLTAQNRQGAVRVGNAPGVDLAGLIVDAGTPGADTLVTIGEGHAYGRSRAGDPTALQDVFFRTGGPHAGRARVSLVVNSSNVILDDIWAWRADHGAGVGWTQNTADTGLIVNGDHVTATGLFVEHYQKFQVIWNGRNGTDVFFQSEMPYDVPSQAAWMSDPNTLGYAAVKVTEPARFFAGYGMGTYSFFNQGIDIYASHAYEVPTDNGTQLNDVLTVFLDAVNGRGGILNVVNDTGGPSTAANADVPVTVVSYP